MSESIEIHMPKLGESIVSATIIQWLKKEGDFIEKDQPLLEVSTDKVNSEIPSPVSGKITKIMAHEGSEYDVGVPLCIVQTSGTHPSPQEESHHQVQKPAPSEGAAHYLSPAVLRLLQEAGIPLSDVEKIPRADKEGRLTKQDVEKYASQKSCKPICPQMMSEEVERVQMSQMRKAIADNMVKSFYQAPHASLIDEVDLTPIVDFIERHKEAFVQKHNVKLTVSSFIAYAISRAVKEYPFINSSVDKDTIVLKRSVNLGIAVSVDQSIMVPVIHRSESKSLLEIATALSSIAKKAKEHQLSPQDVSDGTITMTNFGMSGIKIGIPIIRFPEVAIIGVGAISKKPIAVDPNTVGIRDCAYISLTFDHRALDGMYGCGFLQAIKKHLESFEFPSL